MKSEYVANVEVRNAFGVDLIRDEGEVHLLRVQVNVCGDGHVYVSVDFLAWWEPGNEIGADDLLRSFRYDDQEYSQLGMRDQLEMLTLFTASDILVDKGVHKWPLVVSFNEFQSKVVV